MLKINTDQPLSRDDIKKIVTSNDLSTSEKIRRLFLGGVEIKHVSELLHVRYQFAYNVVSNLNLTNVTPLLIVKERKPSKKDDIMKLLLQGMTKMDVAKELHVPYNMVWKINKDMTQDDTSKEVK